jgi:hypothetical protein
MRRGDVVGCMVCLGALLTAAAALGSSPRTVTAVRPQIVAQTASSEAVKLQATLTRLECLAESTWDRFSNSDEPCLMVTGFKHPGAMTGNSGYRIYSDVDSGEQRAITGSIAKAVPPASGYIIRGTPGGAITAHAAGADPSMVELGPGEFVGFDVRILEHDDANEATLTGTIAGMTRDMAETLHSLPSVIGDVLGFLGDVADGFAHAIDFLADAILGAGDDYVGGHTVVFYRPTRSSAGGPPEGSRIPAGAEVVDIEELAPGVHEKFFFVDGGSDGLYVVVYELTKTVQRRATTTTVQGVPTQPSGSEPTGPITVQGQAVPQSGGGTVRQVTPPGSDTFAITEGDQDQTTQPMAVSLAGVRADKIAPGDFLGDYRLYLDGVPYRLHLLEGKAGALVANVEDMNGRRFEVTDFSAEGYRCAFTIAGLSGKDGRPFLLNGFLLTHTRAGLVGTFQAGGRPLGFYAVKYKPEAEVMRPSTPLPPARKQP